MDGAAREGLGGYLGIRGGPVAALVGKDTEGGVARNPGGH